MTAIMADKTRKKQDFGCKVDFYGKNAVLLQTNNPPRAIMLAILRGAILGILAGLIAAMITKGF